MGNEKPSIANIFFNTGIDVYDSFFKNNELTNEGKAEYLILYSLQILKRLKELTPLLYSYLEHEYFKELIHFSKEVNLFSGTELRIISFINYRLGDFERLLERSFETDYSYFNSIDALAKIRFILFKKPLSIEHDILQSDFIEDDGKYQISELLSRMALFPKCLFINYHPLPKFRLRHFVAFGLG